MRRLLGAVILFTVIVMPRAGSLINPKTVNDQDSVLNLGSEGVTSPPKALSPTPNDRPQKKPTQNRPREAPARYLANPLEFLSSAPVDSLVLLPGIGPVIAERIANARTGKRLFTRWEDLLIIRGIGQKKLDRLKRLAQGTNDP